VIAKQLVRTGRFPDEVLHRVMYPKMHTNGFEKKRKKKKFPDVIGNICYLVYPKFS